MPSESIFQRRFHELLALYRMATRLHIHMAFLAKAECVTTRP